MAEGWELLDILTDFTLGRTMRSILAGQCEDLGTLHIKPASSPKRKLYIRWAESSAREVWGVDCMGSADTADGEMDIASSHHHAPPLTPLSSQGWPVTGYLWYSLTVLCPNFSYTVTYPLIFNYWMTYPFVAISGYEDCLCHGLPEWHFDAAYWHDDQWSPANPSLVLANLHLFHSKLISPGEVVANVLKVQRVTGVERLGLERGDHNTLIYKHFTWLHN